MIRLIPFVVAMLATAVVAAPIDPRSIHVMDGDTIRVGRNVYRLLGFDAPEASRSVCVSELRLGLKARDRLRALIAGGSLDLRKAACPCRRGSEGTLRCNHSAALSRRTVAMSGRSS
jgi:endonuclease YncB( thermonuclease family)